MTRKVLIITQNFYPVIGSAGNRMKNIFQLLNDNDIETNVLTIDPAYPNKNMYANEEFWDDDELNQSTKQIIRVPIKNKKFSNQIFSRLFFYLEIMYRFIIMMFRLRKEKYDYILVSTPPIFIVFPAIIGKLLYKSKLILEVRDLWPDSLIGVKAFDHKVIIKIFRFLEKKMYRSADYIIINSGGFEDHIKLKLKNRQKPIIYLPNGPRVEELNIDKPTNRNNDFRIVYAGNLGLAQDINRLKKLAKLLHDHNIRFDVLGYGMKVNDFTEYLNKYNLTNVHIHHPTTRKKSLQLIKECDLAIAFLNEVDVFSTVLPGKIIDYMTCQTPIVAGMKGVAAQTIEKNKIGYTFSEGDIEKMVNKIIYLKDHRDELNELSKNCINAVSNEFIWENNIPRLINLLNE